MDVIAEFIGGKVSDHIETLTKNYDRTKVKFEDLDLLFFYVK